MALTRYIASLLLTHVSNIVKYQTERGRTLADITESIRERGFRTSLGTLADLQSFWRDTLAVGRQVSSASFSTPLTSFAIPSRSVTDTIVHIAYEVETTLRDGQDKVFGGLSIDLPLGSTVKDVYQAAADHFRNTLQNLYDIQQMAFRITQVYSA